MVETAQDGSFLLKFLPSRSRLELLFKDQAANVARSIVRDGSNLTTENIWVF